MNKIRELTRSSLEITYELFIIMIPTLIIVKILDELGFVEILNKFCAPLMFLLGLPEAMPPDNQDHQSAQSDVQSVEARGGEESACVQVVRQAKGEGEVLDHLTHQKGEPQSCCHQKPVAAAAL